MELGINVMTWRDEREARSAQLGGSIMTAFKVCR